MAEGPPPFLPPPQRQGMSTGKIVLLVGLLVGVPCVGLIGGMIWLVTKGMGMVLPLVECERAFEDVREAIRLYAKDHDGKLPPAATWQDDVKSYLAQVPDRMNSDGQFKIKKLDPSGEWGCRQSEAATTGMAFNADLSNQKLSTIKDPASTMLIFEVPTAKKNANQPYKPVPPNDAPLVMGEHRPWFRIPVEGKIPFKIEKKFGNSKQDSESEMPDSSPK